MAIKSSFSNLFGKSPIKPLQEHMAKAAACAEKLVPFIDAVLKEDWETAKTLQLSISDLENDADEIKRNLKLHLPGSLFLPMPRSDILMVLSAQDRIANKAEDIAGLIIGRKMTLPNEIKEDYHLFLQTSVDASKQAKKAIDALDELLETGFRIHEIKLISEMIVKLDKIEKDTDKQQVHLRTTIFNIEKSLMPIEGIFLYKLIEWTGDLADRSQTVGGQIQLLLAK